MLNNVIILAIVVFVLYHISRYNCFNGFSGSASDNPHCDISCSESSNCCEEFKLIESNNCTKNKKQTIDNIKTTCDSNLYTDIFKNRKCEIQRK